MKNSIFKIQNVIPYLIALSMGVIYLLTASDGMFWQDAPRFIAAISTGGVSKPPEPLYMILAHPLTLVPFGSIVYKIQVLSAVFAVVTLLALFKLTKIILFRITPGTKDRTRLFWDTIFLSSIFALLALGIAPSFWTQAQNADNFILVSLLITLILVLLVAPINKKNCFKRFLLIGAILGFASGTNPIVVCVLPGVFLIASDNRRFLNFKNLVLIGAVGITAMVMVYLYLPLSASQNPFLNWNRPTDLVGIWTLSTGGGLNIYDPASGRTNGFTGSLDVFLISSEVYFQMVWTNFWPFLPLMIFGGIFLLKKSARIFSVMFFAVLINFVLSGIYLSGNQESWFLVSYVVFSVFSGLGFYWLVTKFPRRNYLAMVPFLALFMVLFYRFPGLDYRKWQISEDYIRNLYQAIYPPAIVYGSGDLFFSTSYYAHDVASFGKGVIPIVSEIYRFPWYRENLRLSTSLVVPEPEPGPVTPQNFWRYLNQFFNANISKYRIYITHRALRDDFPIVPEASNLLPQISNQFKLVPAGLTLELVRKDSSRTPKQSDYEYKFYPQDFPKILPDLYVRSYVVEMIDAIHDYAASYQSLADYALGHNNPDLALEYYQKAYKLEAEQTKYTFDPNLEIIGRLGNYYVLVGNFAEARKYFGRIIKLSPGSEYARMATEALKEIKEK